MIGNVSTVGRVNDSAALNQQQGVLPIDYSVTPVNHNNVNVNGNNSNVNISSNVISQPGLHSHNLATNTSTSNKIILISIQICDIMDESHIKEITKFFEKLDITGDGLMCHEEFLKH